MKQLKENARIAIINRGEAAYRFIRAVKEYNLYHKTALKAIAFYTDEENTALFRREADETFALSSFKSYGQNKTSPYLNYNLLMEAITTTGCDGVWVGWGFVSEDALFVEQVEQAGLVFLGPPSRVINQVGDKIQSKELAEISKTPITPWSKGPVKNLDEAYSVAEKIGYPCVVKASNAGGGRGIRFVYNKEELPTQYQSAVDETMRITGNDLVFMERLVVNGRHLEVQALADRHGCVKTFGVRDCSVQRKNQKIIEETPPTHLEDAVLEAIQQSAANLLKAAHYESAGTVEFLYDIDRAEFYFMEVNARLQVEHPITEQLFGVDLVGGQIDVARGKSIEHYNTIARGHVIEVRLNAEDPEGGFRPAGGEVTIFRPAGGIGIRIDSGIDEGSVIPPSFDSMVAKIIATAPSREQALARLTRAVAETRVKIAGGTTNRNFLLELLALKEIGQGGISTRFVENYLSTKTKPTTEAAAALCIAAAEIYRIHETEEERRFKSELMLSGLPRTVLHGNAQEFTLQYLGKSYALKIRRINRRLFALEYNHENYYFHYNYGNYNYIIFNNRRSRVVVTEIGGNFRVEIDNITYLVESDVGGAAKAPSPGLMLSVNVKSGDQVKKGDLLLTLEAMKMELPILATEEAIIGDILVKVGEQVSSGQILIRLEKILDKAPQEDDTLLSEDAFANIASENYQFDKEWLALYLGYDALPAKALIALLQQQTLVEVIDILIASINYVSNIEKLFSYEKISASGYANAMSFADLLVSYYNNAMRKKEDFPQAFNELFEAIKAENALTKETRRTEDRIIFRLFKSHAVLSDKEKTTYAALNYFSENYLHIKNWKEYEQRLTPKLDALILALPSLKQTAVDTQYQLFDRATISSISRKSLAQLERVIQLLATKKDPESQSYLMSKAVSYGYLSEQFLANLVLTDGEHSAIALKILAYRLYRDCLILSYKQRAKNWAELSYRVNNGPLKSVYMVIGAEEELEKLNVEQKITTMIFFTKSNVINSDFLQQHQFLAQNFIVANFMADVVVYQNFINKDNLWQINKDRDFLSPLSYRELRIYRWQNFHKEYEAITPNLVFAHIKAQASEQDERFVAFLTVESTKVEIRHNRLNRLIGLEDALNEAVVVLRKKQALRRHPLYCNRLIIAIRPQLIVDKEAINSYVLQLKDRYITKDLGLARISIIFRGVQNSYEELTLDELSAGGVELNWRKAAIKTIEPMGNYEAKVIKARSRNLIYPYELIEMFEKTTQIAQYGKTQFIEYDLDEKNELICVEGRAYGQNSANLVFGIIETLLEGITYRRVILMSDATGDMGSLSEAECRRVNKALDLAAQEKIPVEWIPISSGARIAMNSGTENLDWTANTLKHIIEFTQNGGEINIIVIATNVGAQSYWNSEATMLMHCKGLLIMSHSGSMLLTGKRALDFAGSVSADNNLGIGGATRIMTPNGETQIEVETLDEAYQALLHYYRSGYIGQDQKIAPFKTADADDRDVGLSIYHDELNQGFQTIGDIFSNEKNGERKKPFDIRKVMRAITDYDFEPLERWQMMQDAETAVVWQTRIGGEACGVIGIESRSLVRRGVIPHNGPESYSGGTLYPQSSKKIARAINSFSHKLPLVVFANLSGFDGSPESLRKNQLEWGAEIGRAIVNFKGPILFTVIGRYHGGAYVVFSKQLNPSIYSIALEGTFASVIGGAPAAAVVFPGQVLKEVYRDARVIDAQAKVFEGSMSSIQYDVLIKDVRREKQAELAIKFDTIHSVARAKEVGSIDEIVKVSELRAKIIEHIRANK